MQRLMLVIAAITFTTPLHAEGITSTPPQNVRFSQQTVPNGITTPPTVLVHPYAAYSDEARQRGIEGNVVVQAQFDEAGNVTVLKVLQGLGHGLDENALAMLKEWRFSPALQNGLPVSAIAEIEVPFYLKNETFQRLQRQLKMLREVQNSLGKLAARSQVAPQAVALRRRKSVGSKGRHFSGFMPLMGSEMPRLAM